jgi:uncharacterized metal-binding protein YceD (DUF177 family)
LVPRHEDASQCAAPEQLADEQQDTQQVVQRPFAGLGELLKRNH